MPEDHSSEPKKHEVITLPGGALAKRAPETSGAMSEMVSRSLVHIQTSKALAMLHRIGEHDLYGPDYRLVCAWAEELRWAPEEVLAHLVKEDKFSYNRQTEI
ncbi:MAG: hypothetical protein ACKVJU_14115 [Verrucomicrobiales bacterium]